MANRRTEFGLDYDLSDINAANDASFTATQQKSFAHADMLIEDVSFSNQMTLEHNYCVLDGKQEEFDDDPDNISYFSNAMSDANGEFTNNPTLTITFSQMHSSLGLTFRFVETYPSMIRIQWYQSNAILYNGVFEISSLEQIVVQPVENYNKIVITFLKTAIPYRYIKLSFLRFGIVLQWHEQVIKTAKLVQQQDIISKQLPISTLSFDIIDVTGDTNVGNSVGIHQYFQKKQVMYPYEIIDGERIELGKYYLDKFSNTKALTKINAFDMIGLLDNAQFEDGEIYDGETAQNIINAIMESAGIEDYDIDGVTAVQLLYGTIKPTTCRNALQEVLFACGSVIDTTDVQKIHIKKLSDIISHPIMKEIKFSTQVTRTAYVSGVKVKYTSYMLNTESTKEITKGLYPAGTNRIVYSEPHANYSIDVGTITDSSSYYVEFTLEEDSEIVITANNYESVENAIQASKEFLQAGEGENVVEFSTTLCNYDTAKILATKLLGHYDNRLELKVKYLATDNIMDFQHYVENIRPDMDNYVARFTQRSFDLTGGMIDTAQMIGYFDTSAYEYYATDFEGADWDKTEFIMDDPDIDPDKFNPII